MRATIASTAAAALLLLLAFTHLAPYLLSGIMPFEVAAYLSDAIERGALWAFAAVLCAVMRVRYVPGAIAAGVCGVAGSTLYACRLLLPWDRAPATDVGLCTQAGYPTAWLTPLYALGAALVLSIAVDRARANRKPPP